jgi:hypothetical protein
MTKFQIVIGGSFLLGGLMAIGAAVLNLDIFMESPKAKPFVDALGRTGARVFYIALGAVLAVAGGLIIAWL